MSPQLKKGLLIGGIVLGALVVFVIVVLVILGPVIGGTFRSTVAGLPGYGGGEVYYVEEQMAEYEMPAAEPMEAGADYYDDEGVAIASNGAYTATDVDVQQGQSRVLEPGEGQDVANKVASEDDAAGPDEGDLGHANLLVSQPAPSAMIDVSRPL